MPRDWVIIGQRPTKMTFHFQYAVCGVNGIGQRRPCARPSHLYISNPLIFITMRTIRTNRRIVSPLDTLWFRLHLIFVHFSLVFVSSSNFVPHSSIHNDGNTCRRCRVRSGRARLMNPIFKLVNEVCSTAIARPSESKFSSQTHSV